MYHLPDQTKYLIRTIPLHHNLHSTPLRTPNHTRHLLRQIQRPPVIQSISIHFYDDIALLQSNFVCGRRRSAGVDRADDDDVGVMIRWDVEGWIVY
eukprot:CAMPEP_0201618536 /NCGR_PEP_ID=MMETSP0492-20130828/39248_1 /ASSEMBLY_ACC=CAM_ASM_000837 /TAXON_ID=420259 /ORGANISM="Thalassiosira gravida, Strain GMp14c1" /LENGTH=95 /DNA_ID=CAMNT_0048087161 /DNA_START=393 /DNA_END=680 /DNA_ORIENTATION=-